MLAPPGVVAEQDLRALPGSTEGQLVLEAGQATTLRPEAIEATLSGDDISTAFNLQFLIDACRSWITDYVRFWLHPPTQLAVTGQKKADEARSRSSATC